MHERLTAALADRYRIERELGAGGMATVYLAEDLKHRRRVAVKVLKPELAAVLGADRFIQEITTTAALQHPHILPLFDSGEADGFLFYVMPFIDGETLRAKLDRETQLGVDVAVSIASSVADALDYAHRNGVIHRDIKPENILLHEGRPMVADFGIALAVSAAAGGRMTETGLSLGTPHYMSPEQATAEKEISARSDTYSLASVLYEMLTGQPPHTGVSAQQIIMKIITEQPADVTSLRKSVPANVAAALAQALEKLPADRFATAADFKAALADVHFATSSAEAGTGTIAAPSWRGWVGDPRSWGALLAVAVLSGITVLGGLTARAPAGTVPAIRVTVTVPVDSSVLSLRVGSGMIDWPVISPAGTHIAFVVGKSTASAIYLRALDSFELREVPGEGIRPFFSPDGASLAFFRQSEIWVLRLTESAPAHVASLPERWWDVFGAVWHPDGRILLAGASGLWAVAASGSTPTLVVATDSAAAELLTYVDVLPDGRILVNVRALDGDRAEVLSADGAKRTRILPGFTDVRVVDDVVFYRQAGQRRASRFDIRRLETTGEPIALADPPARVGRSIAWIAGSGSRDLEPVWVTREGSASPVGLPASVYRWPRVSPDGGRIVVARGTEEEHTVFDLARRTSTTLGGASEPVWSVSGRHVFASTGQRPRGGLVMQVADGSRPPDTLLVSRSGDAWPTSASPDGRWLAYYGMSAEQGQVAYSNAEEDLRFLNLDTRDSRRIPLPGMQRGGRFSPDGQWVAYQSTESGREEVHVRPWPGMDANYQVSNGGGYEPAWAPDSRELYYRHRDAVMVVPIHARDGELERAPPRILFSGVFHRDMFGDQSYDVAPDGRFLMLRPVAGGRLDIQVALNWLSEIRARLDRVQ